MSGASTIVAAVRQGRAIYANMGKFVTYIFASNVALIGRPALPILILSRIVLIPVFLVLRDLGLLNTLAGLIIAPAATPKGFSK